MEYIKFKDSCGVTRRGVSRVCPVCNQSFLTRYDRDFKYCSKKCVNINKKYKYELNRPLIECSWCKKQFHKKLSSLKNSKSKLYFCTRKCKDTAQKLGGIKEIMPPHFGTGKSGLSLSDCDRFAFDTTKCCSCNEDRYYLLCLHHIDGNRQNNEENNLEVVCYNCHTIRHMKYTDKWIVDFKELTPREEIQNLTKIAD